MGTMKLDCGPLPVLLCPPYWSSDRLWPDRRKFSENSNFEDPPLYAPQSQAVLWGQGAQAECIPLGHVGHCSDRCWDRQRSGHEVSYDADIIRQCWAYLCFSESFRLKRICNLLSGLRVDRVCVLIARWHNQTFYLSFLILF